MNSLVDAIQPCVSNPCLVYLFKLNLNESYIFTKMHQLEESFSWLLCLPSIWYAEVAAPQAKSRGNMLSTL